jgi:hypothetical protein
MPAPSTRETLASPTSRPKARAILVYPRVGDEAIETPPLRFSRALCVQHRAAIPTKHRVEVPPNTKPVHLHDPPCHQSRGHGIANCDDTHEHRAIEDAAAEWPRPGRIAVLVVTGDKGTGRREGDVSNAQLVAQDGSVTVTVGTSAELVPSEVFRAKPPEQLAAPKWIGLQFERDVFKQAQAARRELKVAVLPEFLNNEVLGFSTKHAADGHLASQHLSVSLLQHLSGT